VNPGREVVAVRYGTVTLTRSECFYRYHAYLEADGPIRMDYFFWLVRGGAQTILIDTGFAPEVGTRRGRTCLVEPLQALARLGVGPQDVSTVIVSHLHYDHIGNLAAFPDASVVVQRKELNFWASPAAAHLHFAQVVEPTELAVFESVIADGRLVIVDGDADIGDGVGVELVGGHSPGEQLVVVAGAEHPIVIASDALHLYEEMERDRPFALFSDLPEMYAAYGRLAELQASGAAIVAGHDPAVMMRFPALDEARSGLAVLIA